ncbi:MAG TPA: 30S ribosomal protein S6 [Lacipirellulaceae bacterium]|nr:30S ribosomal protein S6 [Lacipirellulaceae bacterium]HMP07451.1 30S ribosomal protein S6 [Lacipirellulaceae bacterium]
MADNTGVYEGLFILDANRFARDRDGVARDVESLVEAAGGELLVSRLWEERRLAYPIKGQRKGAYWLMYFRLPTAQVTGLTRQCEIHDSILRQLFVRLPESLVEPILAHAKGENTAPAPVADVEEPVAVGAGAE